MWFELLGAAWTKYKHLRCDVYYECWIKIDQLDVTRFIISLFTAQHVSNVSTSIFRSLRLTVDLFHVVYCSGSMCVGVTVWFGWGGVVSLCRLHMDVLTLETCWAVNSEIIKQVTSSWSIFIQLRKSSLFRVGSANSINYLTNLLISVGSAWAHTQQARGKKKFKANAGN